MHNPKDKKPYRDADEENTLLEGRNAVTELLRSGQACDKVFIAQGARMGETEIKVAETAAGFIGRQMEQ